MPDTQPLSDSSRSQVREALHREVETPPKRSGEEWAQLRQAPLPHLRGCPGTRFWIRCLAGLFRNRVLEIRGAENIGVDRDPFILVANHNQRVEALLLPAVLALSRGGRMVHFLTDWLVLLYPLIGRIVLLNQPIIVTRKNAKVGWMNWLKRRYESDVPPFEQARLALGAGRSVGIYPEGTMNRDRTRLLRGQTGAAQLSLRSGAPVVPVGIRFPLGRPGTRIGDWEPMIIEFGSPVIPAPRTLDLEPEVHEIRDWHARIMQAISQVSGKQWTPENQRTRYVA